MTIAKAKRLSKVARELNVGVSTIVDFLSSKGIDIEMNPNSKIEADTYSILLEKYQPDKLVKEQKEQAKIQAKIDREHYFGKTEAAVPSSTPAQEKEEVSEPVVNAEPEKKVENKPEEVKATEPVSEESEIEPESTSTDEATTEPVESEESQEDEEGSKAEQKPASEQIETKAEPAADNKEEDPKEEQKFKVLGKIDLDKVSAKPAKKKTAPKEETSQKQEEEVTSEKEAEQPEVPIAEEKTDVADKPETTVEEKTEDISSDKAEEDDVKSPREREAEKDKPKGLTVVGSIDLSKFEKKPKKKPVASTADPNSVQKKKRKRKIITADKAASSTDSNLGSRGARPGGGQGTGIGRPGARGRRPEKVELNEKDIQNKIKATLSRLTGKDKKGASKAKIKKKKKEILRQRAEAEMEQQALDKKKIQVTEFITANELASLMDVGVTDVITACMTLGLMVSINQRIDAETITLVADEFGYEVEFKDVEMDEPSLEEEDSQDNLETRAPIVTIMGHVDHGKTSLLDYVRKSNIIKGEAGGITQHIGAYEVKTKSGQKITFLDTPGHEAFTAMRARGAKVTDIAIIVVAADDRVMPQTKEAISHAQAAGVPMIFAINKIDREQSNPDSIKQQLADMNVLVEEWGGKYQSQDISAKTGLNVEDLLEKVLLEAELLELKADADKRANGTVVEASLDKGKGIVTTVLVQAGTLNIGDFVIAGQNFGKVKAMFDESGRRVKSAGPSTPVALLGFDGAPTAGDKFYVTKSEAEGKNIATHRAQLIREQGIRASKHVTLDEIGRRIAIGNFKELNVIVKGDVDGSVEALSDSLIKLSTEEIQVNVIHKAVGQISESDVLLASASDAIIIGFQVRPSAQARGLAEKEQIDIRLYSVIYDAIDELKSAMEGMLEPATEEKIQGSVEIREVFKITKVGTIAGCMVTSGKVYRDSKIRLIRDGVVKYTGALASLKRYKDDVKEVASGYECGLNLEKFNDIETGDIIEAYEEVKVKRKL